MIVPVVRSWRWAILAGVMIGAVLLMHSTTGVVPDGTPSVWHATASTPMQQTPDHGRAAGTLWHAVAACAAIATASVIGARAAGSTAQRVSALRFTRVDRASISRPAPSESPPRLGLRC